MVIRSVPAARASRRSRHRCWSLPTLRAAMGVVSCWVVAAGPWCARAGAQEPPPPAAEPAPASAVPAQDAAYGRVVVDELKLRCWSGAVATPPLFEDVLVKDQVVQLGRTENGFRLVVLPMGPLGYVSKQFTTTAQDGAVTTKVSKVAFRYRPRTTEAPVQQLAEGTVLHVVGEQDDWYRVRVPGIEAWAASAEVQVVDGQDPAVRAANEQLTQKYRAEVQARLDAIAAQKRREEQDRIDLAAVKVVEDAFAGELGKPVEQQRFDPLKAALDKLTPTLGAESQARVAVQALQKRIETQQWIAEATAVANSKPPVEEGDKPPPPPTDQLERFVAIGWLRYESHLTGPGTYFVEKGGRRLYALSCQTGRFDLALFVGREVGVQGPRRQPGADSLGTLDVERIEVLGAAPQ